MHRRLQTLACFGAFPFRRRPCLLVYSCSHAFFFFATAWHDGHPTPAVSITYALRDDALLTHPDPMLPSALARPSPMLLLLLISLSPWLSLSLSLFLLPEPEQRPEGRNEEEGDTDGGPDAELDQPRKADGAVRGQRRGGGEAAPRALMLPGRSAPPRLRQPFCKVMSLCFCVLLLVESSHRTHPGPSVKVRFLFLFYFIFYIRLLHARRVLMQRRVALERPHLLLSVALVAEKWR